MVQEQKRKIGKATFVIVRKFTGKESLENKLKRLILEK
ncbi:Uncharacterised protein [Streptococcus suis]|nr:Uncharacterised protein [Streptococcus suis]